METNNKTDDSEVNIDKSNHENIDDDHESFHLKKGDEHKKIFCTDLGGVPSIKNIFSTKILAKSIKDIMTIVACKPTPSIGTPSEVSGRNDGIRSKNTIMASKIVVTNPILSPLSTGMRKLVRASIISKLLGNVR
ncbi:hypothetical protein P5673_021281 [Acropora cervicornis]|uniref:Uncharacterized protein n=1 Tax=Acropora cervicornis TaxID=6130 RepID=A0AAD9Q8N2_ACRCE|nr:hypothetical protein P5673_021281 [Acropora cervicornis]